MPNSDRNGWKPDPDPPTRDEMIIHAGAATITRWLTLASGAEGGKAEFTHELGADGDVRIQVREGVSREDAVRQLGLMIRIVAARWDALISGAELASSSEVNA